MPLKKKKNLKNSNEKFCFVNGKCCSVKSCFVKCNISMCGFFFKILILLRLYTIQHLKKKSIIKASSILVPLLQVFNFH